MKTLAELLADARESLETVVSRLEDECQGLYQSGGNYSQVLDVQDSVLESIGTLRLATHKHGAWLRGE